MHLLIITHIFWPEGADYKNRILAEEFARRGHDVTVLAPFPNYPLGRVYDGYRQSWRQWEYMEGFRVLRVPLYPKHSRSAFERMLNYMSFTLSASTIGFLLSGKVDVIFVFSPPMTLGWPAGLFRLFRGTPILLDVVDLWPEAIIGSGMVSRGFIPWATEWIAKTAYKISTKMTVLTEGYRLNLIEKGVPAHKMEVIPPWADGSVFYETDPDPEFGRKYNLVGKFNVIYTGNIGPFQDFSNILKAAELLRDVDRLRFVLVGEGQDKEKMARHAKKKGINNVIFTDAYSTKHMSGIMAWADALLITLRGDSYLAINLPSKICTYMAAGRPILACAKGVVVKVVEESGIGLTCPPGNPDQLAKTLLRLLGNSKEDLKLMGERSRLLFKTRYDEKIVVGRYVELLESMGAMSGAVR